MDKEIVAVCFADIPNTLFYRFDPKCLSPNIGDQVHVELGKRIVTAWVTDIYSEGEALKLIELSRQGYRPTSRQTTASSPNVKFKHITSLNPTFQQEQVKLFQWMSDYYAATLGEIFANAAPRRAKPKLSLRYRFSDEFLKEGSKEPLKSKSSRQQSLLVELSTKSFLEDDELRETFGEEYPKVKSSLNILIKKGIVSIEKYFSPDSQEVYSPSYKSAEELHNISLNNYQTTALSEIEGLLRTQKFSPLLLFGVTGSGKTEVYLRAIDKVLHSGGSALLVVPEISLTPQIIDNLSTRLNSEIAVLHSNINYKIRTETWDKIFSGKIRLAIGARSAIFAPLRDLKLIIVDEEHDSSYKQSEGFRYHARDLAVMRAKFSSATVILGSATPSLESIKNVQDNKYKIFEIPERVNSRPLPKIEIVNLKVVKKGLMPSENISPELYREIKKCLEEKKQVIILYNKRGFASYLQCVTCSEALMCPSCSVTLTYHQKKNRLVCHYCNFKQKSPKHCPQCRNPKLSFSEELQNEDTSSLTKKDPLEFGLLEERGSGTERITEELAQLFPGSEIIRMDRDAITSINSYKVILDKMRSQTADILVGTQMIAKGHDLPNVTLVGIIDADVGLHMPDFRNSEKVFQLLTQASGRAGRGEDPGKVIIQTRNPNSSPIVGVITGRFKAFARYQLEQRQKLNYPPWSKLMRVVISSPDKQDAYNASLDLGSEIHTFTSSIEEDDSTKSPEQKSDTPITKNKKYSIMGPAPAPHEKLRDRYRWQILIKANSSKHISELGKYLNLFRHQKTGYKDLRIAIDIDPQDMM